MLKVASIILATISSLIENMDLSKWQKALGWIFWLPSYILSNIHQCDQIFQSKNNGVTFRVTIFSNLSRCTNLEMFWAHQDKPAAELSSHHQVLLSPCTWICRVIPPRCRNESRGSRWQRGGRRVQREPDTEGMSCEGTSGSVADTQPHGLLPKIWKKKTFYLSHHSPLEPSDMQRMTIFI